MKLDRLKLIKGDRFIFSTPENTDDFREAELSLCSRNKLFTIRFNGTIIHSSKTFKSLINRFDKLKNRWDLSFSRLES